MSDQTNHNVISSHPMTSLDSRLKLGAWLHDGRVKSGLSIEAIAQETRIGKQYIVSLEHGKLDELPGRVFGRGFVKNISRLVKIDAAEGLQLYDACWGPDAARAQSTTETNSANRATPETIVATHKNSNVTNSASAMSQPLLGSKPKSSENSLFNWRPKYSLKLRIPQWVVQTVARPQVVLWILAGIVSAFVSLTFGRWAIKQYHDSKAKMTVTQPMVAVKAKDNAASNVVKSELLGIEQEQAIRDLENNVSNSAPLPASAGVSTHVEPQKSTVDAKAIVAEDDNPLLMATNSSASFEQVMELKVSQNVEIRMVVDGKKYEKTWFEAQTHRIAFTNRAEIFISDASLVDVIYNGKSLGALGNKGRKRKILLQAKATADDFPH